MGLTRILRRARAGAGLALLGTLGGFVAGLFRRHAPSPYVTGHKAPPADD